MSVLSVKELSPSEVIRLRISVSGIVQGVGFRPFLYRKALDFGLSGFARNTMSGVDIEVEGSVNKLEKFIDTLRCDLPPYAKIDKLEKNTLDLIFDKEFRILPSAVSSGNVAKISPDLAICEDCLEDIKNPNNRRYLYQFTNCTNCGPRFTIIKSVPYDRSNTTMQEFPLCFSCEQEYNDPMNRRYHAQSNACHECGPQVTFLNPSGNFIAKGNDAINKAREFLANGRILAIKGLGGFHLACDATNDKAVIELRKRKPRPEKPVAVMFEDISEIKKHCEISSHEINELTGVRRPILLLKKIDAQNTIGESISPEVAPNNNYLGAMLPYTPLHYLLFDDVKLKSLVMTSGNITNEPIVTENSEAVSKLGKIADAIVVNDRKIWNRCDDSVGYFSDSKLMLLRRSRGFVPLPLETKMPLQPTLSFGAMYNNTFAIADKNEVFISQHIGDVDNFETLNFLKQSIEKFKSWLKIEPKIFVHDLHPDLLTTHLAHELAQDARIFAVQHHHAHLASAIGALQMDEQVQVQGLVLDGTGWGDDNTVWGGELLVGSACEFHRIGHLSLLPLPGLEVSIRKPIRMAVAYLHDMIPSAKDMKLDIWKRIQPEESKLIRHMVNKKFNTLMTSSAGRLFDVVASLLGICDEISYQGQAAIELEQCALKGKSNNIPRLQFSIEDKEGIITINPRQIIVDILNALVQGLNISDLAFGFHEAFSEALSIACSIAHDKGAPKNVVLCGGVFQNRLLTWLTEKALREKDLSPIIPGEIPVNDAGIALGQVLVANAKLSKE